ncbi:MAG: hypothetical protein IBJ11_10795 [Phycisphaerales bacterium]|nr:hypothetical protein [Phycisphaerales bacterium]
MKKDKRSPALYELLGEAAAASRAQQAPPSRPTPASPAPPPPPRPAAPPPPQRVEVPRPVHVAAPHEPQRPAPVAAPPAGDEPEDRVLWFRPGQVLRVPVGYLFVAAGLLIAVAIFAYLLGYQKRDGEYKREQEALAARTTPDVTEPLRQPGPNGQTAPTGATAGPGRPEPARPADRPNAGRPSEPPSGRRIVPVDGVIFLEAGMDDPRESGKHYYILATAGKEETDRIARFLGGKGVDVIRLPPNNAGLSQVVGLRAFESGKPDDPDAVEYRRQVQRLGREWRQTQRGATEFADMYLAKYTPRRR